MRTYAQTFEIHRTRRQWIWIMRPNRADVVLNRAAPDGIGDSFSVRPRERHRDLAMLARRNP